MPSWIHTADGRGLAGMVGPGGDAEADQSLDPARRPAGRRLQHPGGQPEGHARLHLQEAVDDPQGAEPDPQHPAGDGLRAPPPVGAPDSDSPRATARRYCMERSTFQATTNRTRITKINAPWRTRASWKAR